MKKFWDITIDRYDTEPKVLIAVLRCDPRFAMRKEDLEEWMAIGRFTKELMEKGIVNPDKDFGGVPARERIKILQ